MGLPRQNSIIRIYSVILDLVVKLENILPSSHMYLVALYTTVSIVERHGSNT